MDEEVFDESELFSTFDSVEDSNRKAIHSKTANKKRNQSSTATSSNEMDSIKRENKLLKNVLRKISSAAVQDTGGPVATIIYYPGTFSSGKQHDIEEFIKHIAKDDNRKADKNNDLCNGFSHGKGSSLFDAFELALEKRTHLSDEEDDGCSNNDLSCIPAGTIQYFSSFCLDSFGSAVDDQPTQIPSYEQVYFNILPQDNTVGKRTRAKKSCFNCGGEHKLQDCPKPRDLARINSKRKEFMNSFSSPFRQEARYHADKDQEEKFKHLVPGKISDNLRKALGLSSHDLPPYVYRMRMLRYPPGWLPSNHDSGIVMYGKEGKADIGDGEGQVMDPERFAQFPGFNVPVPNGKIDLSLEVHLPQISSRDMLPDSSHDSASSKKAGQKRSGSENDADREIKRGRTLGSAADMEIDNENLGTSIIAFNDTNLSEDFGTPTNGPRSPRLSLETGFRTSTPLGKIELEDGEIPESPTSGIKDEKLTTAEHTPAWWLEEPLKQKLGVNDRDIVPPPFPLRPLPLHKISQILPGDTNHISSEDRNLWLDPIFGNLQVRTGRYDKLKIILASRDSRR